MPLVPTSSFSCPKWLVGGHRQTIVGHLIPDDTNLPWKRERFETEDGDFLDIDWLKKSSPRLLFLVHGLEGHARRTYMTRLAANAGAAGWDIAAVNLRGCSGEPNRFAPSYHSGKSDDLRFLLKKIVQRQSYRSIGMVGISIGGNLILKLLAEYGETAPPPLKAAVAFSVPCDLAEAAKEISRQKNFLYNAYFLKKLSRTIKRKEALLEPEIRQQLLMRINNLEEFDGVFTAPLNGFLSALHYYRSSSSLYYLMSIRTPALIVNAQDDPFLGPRCYPYAIAERHPLLSLETPATGGHVGFVRSLSDNHWLSERALSFLTPHCKKRG